MVARRRRTRRRPVSAAETDGHDLPPPSCRMHVCYNGSALGPESVVTPRPMACQAQADVASRCSDRSERQSRSTPMTRPSWLIPAGCVLAVGACPGAAVGARRARHRAPPTHSRRTITRCSTTCRVGRSASSGTRPIRGTGIVRDRARTDGSTYPESHREIGSIASTGFGLTGLCIAAERGWQPDRRAEGARPRHAAVLRGQGVSSTTAGSITG